MQKCGDRYGAAARHRPTHIGETVNALYTLIDVVLSIASSAIVAIFAVVLLICAGCCFFALVWIFWMCTAKLSGFVLRRAFAPTPSSATWPGKGSLRGNKRRKHLWWNTTD